MEGTKLYTDFLNYSTVKNSYALSAITVLYYDYLLTLPLEIDRFWSRTFSWATLLFYLNRYGALAAHIPVLMEYFWTSFTTPEERVTTCHTYHVYHQYYALAAQLIIGVLLIMRTHALYERSKKILGLLLGIGFAGIGVAIWSILTAGHPEDPKAEYWPPIGCIESLTQREGQHLAIAWGALLVFDSTIYLLTLRKAFGAGVPKGESLFKIILRDASIYIAIIVAANISNVLTLVIAPTALKGISTTFSNIMASVMISRFMFNLRDPALLTPGMATSQPAKISTLRFANNANAHASSSNATYSEMGTDSRYTSSHQVDEERR